jgi:hypothetical protein
MNILETDVEVSADGGLKLLSPLPAWLIASVTRIEVLGFPGFRDRCPRNARWKFRLWWLARSNCPWMSLKVRSAQCALAELFSLGPSVGHLHIPSKPDDFKNSNEPVTCINLPPTQTMAG